MICHSQVIGKTKDGKYYQHPCGQCLACRINNCRSWFVRTMWEIKKLERPYQYFVTLTYRDEDLPKDNLCTKEELKKYLNNLNNSFKLGLRYYAVSDYGSDNGRPHYHLIVLSTKKILTSQFHRIWKKGYVYIKPLKPWNIKYTCRYTVKKKPLKSGEEGFFRLISKGWGDNAPARSDGYYIFDGKRYSIPMYNQKKLAIKKDTFMSNYLDQMILRPQYKNVADACDNKYSSTINEVELYLHRRKTC